ncbi:MAG: ornithine cyclodeaminase family protein [Acidobacteriota bacterium]|nr:ornithine cyclodeaminase family protein [Acidobacteriota bacterium]
MKPRGTLLLTRREVAALLTIEECIAAVERAFKLHGDGNTTPPGILGVHAKDGGFHIKAGLLELERTYFAAKVNANFPQNVERFGLPLIQGVIVLCDGENGYPLALMDSIEITIQRTGAATAVAAKYLARPNSKIVTICGCGNQGQISLRALARVFSLENVFAWDADPGCAERFAAELSEDLKIKVEVVTDLAKAVSGSDICVSCTPSKQPFLKKEFVSPGTFIAAVGADSPEKQELEPGLIAGNKLVVDVLGQCVAIGELHHGIESSLVGIEDVHAELGEVIAGVKAGRTSTDEIIIFDSTGMALQDVISATLVYEKAIREGKGMVMNLAA